MVTRTIRSEPIPTPVRHELPSEFDARRLARRALGVIAVLVVLLLVVVLAPGLGEVRKYLASADPGWLVAGVALEALSCCPTW